jgi:hypothetical protein
MSGMAQTFDELRAARLEAKAARQRAWRRTPLDAHLEAQPNLMIYDDRDATHTQR